MLPDLRAILVALLAPPYIPPGTCPVAETTRPAVINSTILFRFIIINIKSVVERDKYKYYVTTFVGSINVSIISNIKKVNIIKILINTFIKNVDINRPNECQPLLAKLGNIETINVIGKINAIIKTRN